MRSNLIRSVLTLFALAGGYLAATATAAAMPGPYPSDDDYPVVVAHSSGTWLWVFVAVAAGLNQLYRSHRRASLA